eukprot:295231-Pelagomonas_calceolata.AAC.3
MKSIPEASVLHAQRGDRTQAASPLVLCIAACLRGQRLLRYFVGCVGIQCSAKVLEAGSGDRHITSRQGDA